MPQHSPSEHPESQSLKSSPRPFHQDPVSSSHAPSHPDLTEPPDQDPAELHHNPESVKPQPVCSQSNPATVQLTATEVHLCPLETQPDPQELHHSPSSQLYPSKLLHSPEAKELVDEVAQLHCDLTQFENSPEHMDSPHGLSSPHSEPTKLQRTAVSSHANLENKPDYSDCPGNLVGTRSYPTESPESPKPADDHIEIRPNICITDPVEIHHSSAHLTQTQHHLNQLSHGSSSPIRSSTEGQLTATTPPHSPERHSSILCSEPLSPPSSVQLQPGSSTPQQTPPHIPCQQSPRLHRPAQDCISHLPQNPTEESEPTLVQERLGSSQLSVQSGVTFNSTSRSFQEVSDCIPIPTGLADKSLTVEKCLASLSTGSNSSTNDGDEKLSKKLSPASSGRLSPDHFSPAPAPSNPTTQSVVHTEKSQMSEFPPPVKEMLPPPPQSPCGSCLEVSDIVKKSSASSLPTNGMPTIAAASVPACASAMKVEPNLAHDENSGLPSSLLESPVRSPGLPASLQAETPCPTYLNLCQSNKTEVAAHHCHRSIEPEKSDLSSPPDSLDPVSIVDNARVGQALRDPVDEQETSMFTVCGSAEVTQSNVSLTGCAQLDPSHAPRLKSPSQTTSLTSARPLPSNQGDQAAFSANITEPHFTQSPPRSSLAGQGSPLNVEKASMSCASGASSAATTQSSLAQTTVVGSPHSLAQSSQMYCGPVVNTVDSPGPGSRLNIAKDISLNMLSSFLPCVDHLESGPKNPDNVGEIIAQPAQQTLNLCIVESQQSCGSSSPLCLTPAITDPNSGPRGPVCPAPTQFNSSLPECSHIVEAPACPQVLSPTLSSRPADRPKCGSLQTHDTEVHPGPVSVHSEDIPSTGPESVEQCCHATLTSLQQNRHTQREPAAAQSKYEEKTVRVQIRFSLCDLPVDPNWADEEVASEKINEKDDKREVPLQEEQMEECGESNDSRGESQPEKCSKLSPPLSGRKPSSKITISQLFRSVSDLHVCLYRSPGAATP